MKYKIYLATKVKFGKYKDKDKSVYELIKEDIDYVNWLMDNPFSECYVDPRVTKMFNEYWEKRNYQRYGFRNDNLNN
jgi:hypothetical protein